MNPLLQFAGLPRFDEIKPEHVAPAIDELLAAGREQLVDSGSYMLRLDLVEAG